ncbi:MAG: peptide-methionine (S)-S-oxide reductase [Chloroflexia bacterium]|nr:peptide-methionine (S)-S-oxide reductase [Chloroflexia bacterium]
MRTRVGYAGGSKENPSYYNLGDHSETIQIDYDPRQISYEQLLDVFWNGHSPTTPSWSRQYASLILYHDEEQQRLAQESLARYEARWQRKIHTQIVPLDTFYLAEDYHQKYRLRGQPKLLREIQAIYPRLEDFVNSTAVARLNGYAAGYGSSEQLDQELGRLGLSPEAQRYLRDLIDRYDR